MKNNITTTIIIVAGPGDKTYVEKNIKLINLLNKDKNFVINIIDNQCHTGKIQNNWELDVYPECNVFAGVSQDSSLPINCRGSYQHGMALTQAVRANIDTAVLVIMDPDFYVIKKDWINDLVETLNEGKSFVGAPWHPKWWPKYRRFPCVHFMGINLKNIDCRKLNFIPDVAERAEKKLSRESKVENKRRKRIIHRVKSLKEKPTTPNMIFKIFYFVINKCRLALKIVIQNTKGRLYIGSSHDTGHYVYMTHKNISDSAVEVLLPYVDFEKTYGSVIHLKYRIGRLLEKLVINKYAYIDSKSKVSDKNFQQFGLPDLDDYGWEEFFNNEGPYGFHMRRFNKLHRNIEEELTILDSILRKISSKIKN